MLTHVGISVRPGFHYTTNATSTTQKQSDYKVEQPSFTPIALFLLEIGRCRGRNWLNGNQALGASLKDDKFDLFVWLLLFVLSLFSYSKALNFARACD